LQHSLISLHTPLLRGRNKLDSGRSENSMKALAPTLLAALCAAAASVAVADLNRTFPKNVDLTGLWKINADESDNPQKLVAKQRRDSANGRTSGGGNGVSVGVGGGGIVFGGGAIGTMGRGGPSSGGSGTADRPKGDPEPASMAMPLDSFLATVDQFEIQQQPDEVTITTEDGSSTCKPTVPSKAPVPGGEMANRRCGWHGKAYVVELQLPGDEVTRSNSYELRKDGQQLVMVTEIKGGHTPLSGLRIERVYDRIVTH
jgi:hypothetical protein